MTGDLKKNAEFSQSLVFLVEIAVIALERQGGPTPELEAWAREVGVRLAHGGDEVQFRDGKGASAAPRLGDIAKALAIGAWAPGGLDLYGHHFEVKRA